MNGLTLITAPTLKPIQQKDVRDHLYIEQSDTDRDSYLLEIQDSAVDQFQSEAEYQVMSATYKLTLPDFPSEYIDIPLIPVTSITTFSYYTNQTETGTLIENTDYYMVKTDRSARLYPFSSWPSSGDRADAVQITFVAGYTDRGDIPSNLIHGLKFLIGHYHENRQSVVVGPNVQTVPESYGVIVDKFKRYSF